jgi:hypothetical protein
MEIFRIQQGARHQKKARIARVFAATLREKEAGSRQPLIRSGSSACIAEISRCLRIAYGFKTRVPIAGGHIVDVAAQRKIIAW